MLEVVIATFIFATVVILLIGVWAKYASSLANSRNHLAASSLAKQILEQHVAYGFAGCVPPGEPLRAVSASTRIRGRQVEQTMNYQFTVTDNATQTFRHLIVTVTWTDDTGNKSLIYDTFLYRTQ